MEQRLVTITWTPHAATVRAKPAADDVALVAALDHLVANGFRLRTVVPRVSGGDTHWTTLHLERTEGGEPLPELPRGGDGKELIPGIAVHGVPVAAQQPAAAAT